MQLPLNEIIDRIKESTALSQTEIEAKISEKSKQLSGLISKEGAAQIIANELGVKLFSVGGPVKIDRIVGGMRSVQTAGKIVKKYDVSVFKTSDGSEGKVGSLVLGDDTGRIRLTFWHDMAEKLAAFNEGDILKVVDAYSKVNNNRVELHMTASSKFMINPPGISIGEVKEYISRRKKIKDLTENDDNVEILGTVVQVFEPRFFEICPECSRRARPSDGAYKCVEHGTVSPAYSYVMNVVLDDGTDNLRAVCFKNQATVLVGKGEPDILRYRTDPSSFEDVKQDLLGMMVKMVGRVTKNSMFDRLEFVSQMVFRDVKPE